MHLKLGHEYVSYMTSSLADILAHFAYLSEPMVMGWTCRSHYCRPKYMPTSWLPESS